MGFPIETLEKIMEYIYKNSRKKNLEVMEIFLKEPNIEFQKESRQEYF